MIRAESARRARVTRAARLFMLRRRVHGHNDTAATAATTTGTTALLGKGEFVFDPRCPSDIVPKILVYASGTALDDEIRELEAAAVPGARSGQAAASERKDTFDGQLRPLQPAQHAPPPLPLMAAAAPRAFAPAALAAMSTQELLLLLRSEEEKGARLRREQMSFEHEQTLLEERIRACRLARAPTPNGGGVVLSPPAPAVADGAKGE